ncbi:hypothetical protein DF286_00015 [Sphingosinicella humi]|uniref:Uncharacterized protein n=1 Tax=Allosphingosinicella humi TaxID=2068657 RepID=A0A2U2IZC7_9SPHN|nr:hypothetical protein DF286_00015 [Sphingosinicella humi]
MAVFVLLTLVGLALAFLVFLGLAMGECLPRDESSAMHACDAAKQREFWLYPLLVLLSVAAAIWLEVRGSPFGRIVAALSGIIAFCALYLVEMF